MLYQHERPERGLPDTARVFLNANDRVDTDFQRFGGITDTGTIKGHIDDVVLRAGLRGFIDKRKLKSAAT
ncbi:hypothetical protein SSYM_0761 [Serratia symbiotica str. Tucson]|uniref:Uncharacterized protein n=2 Tax=Serratia symbiotica TaxID=138074 RepID=E9CKR9_9GAMM|nr:hypothetical protein SSYM_0761 [Serratia symbiotica str. Tucson]BBI92806.1 uncharacterized protein SSYIS1_27090 [Serratia symbiotica]